MDKFIDLGGNEQQDLTFLIEVEGKVFYQPIMLAAVIGNAELLRELLKNPTVDVDAKCD